MRDDRAKAPRTRRRRAGGLTAPGRTAPSLIALGRDRSGDTTVEFAVVGSVMISLMLLMLETGWQMVTETALAYGARTASRFGITGQTTVPGANPQPATRAAAIQYLVTARTAGILDPMQVSLSTKSYGSPAQFGNASDATAGAGSSGSIVEYDVSYTQPYLTPIAVAITGQTGVTHHATVIVQNEPF
ncbi:MAG: pilus assembly protein [Acidisphaera sp.]|nr:pilus assembly protein [Acidisphaera sp.]